MLVGCRWTVLWFYVFCGAWGDVYGCVCVCLMLRLRFACWIAVG